MPDNDTSPVRSFLSSPLSLAVLLCIPVVALVEQMTHWPWTKDSFHSINHSAGELAARLLIASLAVTPLRKLFPKSQIVRWFARRRRILGIYSFVFAVIHLTTYLVTRELGTMAGNLTSPKYIIAWIAFLILLLLAATSFDAAMRKLGKRWKKLHRFAHVAAIAVAVHWVLMSNSPPVYLHFVPLLGLQAYRVYVSKTRKKR